MITKLSIIIGVLLLALLIYNYGLGARSDDGGEVVINNHSFTVDVVETIASHQKGLSGRESLGDDEGMLFVFPKASTRRFWMKGMLIPIDIIWIHDGVIVGIEKNVQPEPGVSLAGLKSYKSPVPVEYVLEVGSGIAEKSGITVGDTVSIRL